MTDVAEQVDKALRTLASDESSALGRSFSWRTGWLTADRVTHAFVQVDGLPAAIATARNYLASRFELTRVETGLLTNRRSHPFMVARVSRKAS